MTVTVTANRSIPVDVAFRGLACDPVAEARCARWVYELDRVAKKIRRCHVSIDRVGLCKKFTVKVVMMVDGRQHITSRANDGQHDLQLAIADAFLAARTQLR